MVPFRHFLVSMQVLEVAFLQPCLPNFVISFCHITPGPFILLESFSSLPPELLVILSLHIIANLKSSAPGQQAGWQGCPENSLRADCWAFFVALKLFFH